MATYEAVTDLKLRNGKIVKRGETVDTKFLRSDVQSLLEQGHIVEPGTEPTVARPPTPYVSVNINPSEPDEAEPEADESSTNEGGDTSTDDGGTNEKGDD